MKSIQIGVVMGSSSDWDTMQHAVQILEQFGIAHEARVVSAHRMPDDMFAYAEAAAGRGLKAIIERGMVRSGRLARIKVSARDVPGVLARITATVADAGANIEEVHHQRAFTMLAAQNVEIELVLQTRGKSHVEQVLGQLRTAGMEAALM